MLGQQEESSGIGSRIGMIEGVLIPDSPKFQLTQGGFVWLSIRIQNTGDIAIIPWIRIRVQESALIGAGPLLYEFLFQDIQRQPGDIATYKRGYFDDGPVEGRDVFIKVSPVEDMTKPSYPGGEDHWASAYSVVGPVAGVSVLDLTLS